MRIYPTDKFDEKELKKLNVEDWQAELLKLNPSYPFWGNYEDYMSDKNSGWGEPIEYNTFDEMFELNELNECVNFYFELYRKNHVCSYCNASGYNPETKQLSDDWYDFEHTGRKWNHNITDVEVKALVEHNRLKDLTHEWTKENGWQKRDPDYIPTAEEVNKWSREGMGHDAINQWICVEARAKHLGVWGNCEKCNGEGYIYDEEKGKVGLQLWILHPRKGCSRGIYIKEIKQNDLLKVKEFLLGAAKRNAERFSKIKKNGRIKL